VFKEFSLLTFKLLVGSMILFQYAWGQTQLIGEVPAGSSNGTNAVFTLKYSPYSGTLAVYKNGLRLTAGLDYSAAGNKISFSSPSIPQLGDGLTADYTPLPVSFIRPITVNHAKVANSDPAGFPVYLVLSDPALRTVANGGHVQSTVGTDIAFYSDAATTQVLPFEIVSYNGVSGALTAVVRYPSLSHTTDTVFYLVYGSSTVTASLANLTAVWAGYAGVYHLEDSTDTTQINNSAAGEGLAGNGISVNSASAMTTTGTLGLGLVSNGTTDRLDLGSYSTINSARALTYSGWVKFNSLSEYALVLGKFDSSQTSGSGITLSGHWTTSDQDWLTAVRTSSSTADTTNAFGIQPNVWYHFTYLYSAGSAALYINGVPVKLVHYGPATPAAVPTVAADLFAGTSLSGALDELRISTRSYTGDWISTEYNNQSSPSSFASLGAELSQF
jgi:concanavalin A-like lectin/glucanase superfamily protein